MNRLVVALAALAILGGIACGAMEDPDAEAPLLLVAYVDEAGDARIRGEPDAGAWVFKPDGEIFGMSWSPVGDRLLITERLGDEWQLRLIETTRFTEVGRVPLAERPAHTVTWRRDGAAFVLSGLDSAVAYSRGGSELWSVDPAGLPIGWSPDGRWFAFAEGSLNLGRLTVTNGSVTHVVTREDLELQDGVGFLAGPWLLDGTIAVAVGTLIVRGNSATTDQEAWHLSVSDAGVEVGAPIDPRLGVEVQLASEARDADGEAAHEALVNLLGGPSTASDGPGGLHWVSARYDDADGHHRVFARRDGAVLSELQITIDFGDVRFPQVAAVARPPDR